MELPPQVARVVTETRLTAPIERLPNGLAQASITSTTITKKRKTSKKSKARPESHLTGFGRPSLHQGTSLLSCKMGCVWATSPLEISEPAQAKHSAALWHTAEHVTVTVTALPCPTLQGSVTWLRGGRMSQGSPGLQRVTSGSN